MQNKHRPPQLSIQVESIHLRSSKVSCTIMIHVKKVFCSVIGINDPVPPLYRKGSSRGQTKYESSAEHWPSKGRTVMSRNWHRSTGDRPDTPKLGKRRQTITQTNETTKCGAQYFEHRFQVQFIFKLKLLLKNSSGGSEIRQGDQQSQVI